MLIKIVQDLRRAQGRNEKIKVLKQHKDNEKWKKFLKFVYDGSISFGVSSPTSFEFAEVEIDNLMFQVLTELSTRKYTGNKAKDVVKWLSSTYGEIPRLILDRSLKAGISLTTINSVYDNLVPEFKTMKGVDVPIVEYPVLTSIKYDGCKVFVEVRLEGITIRTSSGTIFQLKSLSEEMRRMSYGVYEGELIHDGGKQVDRPIITGYLNSLLSGTCDDLPLGSYHYAIYDYITSKEWDSKIGTYTFKERQEHLRIQFETDIPDSAILVHVRQTEFNNEQSLLEYTNKLIDSGWEGTMSRYENDVYMFTGDKRTNRLIKKKANKETILECVGFTPHTNPSKGNVGSLLCKGTVQSKTFGRIEVEVNVGSGMGKFDIMREGEWYVGKQIEIVYNTETETETGYSLFLPRFKRVVNIDKI